MTLKKSCLKVSFIIVYSHMADMLDFRYERLVGSIFILYVQKIKLEYLKVPMKRNFLFCLTKGHNKLEDCRLPFLNILFGSRVIKL